MNYPPSQPIATFLQQRPPPTAQTDCFFTYTRISSQCKPVDRIADSIDPFELANNTNQIPSSNIAQDVHHSVNTLYDIQKKYLLITNSNSNNTIYNLP